MKPPSLAKFSEHALHSFLRFPLVIISAYAGTFLAIYLVEIMESDLNPFPLLHIMLSCALGIPLFFAARVFYEKKNLGKRWLPGIYLLATMLVFLIYLSFPGGKDLYPTSYSYVRYAIINGIIHLLVTFLLYLPYAGVYGFWNYNMSLFFRIITALFYSITLYLGIAIALLALQLLFEIDFDPKLYLQLFILIIGLFNTWFFLSGTPQDFEQLEEKIEYPKLLKVFSQYILLPLLILYFLILYAYGIKIVILWDWPKGIVSYLVIYIAALGIFTHLLLYPFLLEKEITWIKFRSKAFYVLMLPLLALLFIAVYMRISDYGFTINRYLVLLLGIWMTVTCFYFIIGKGNLKFIPMTLAFFLLFSSFGPWGFFMVSEKSQIKRLEGILSGSDILVNGKIEGEVLWDKKAFPELVSQEKGRNNFKVSDSLNAEVSSIIYYLHHHHGLNSIHPWFSQDLDIILNEVNKDKLKYQYQDGPSIYLETLGLSTQFRNSSEIYYLFQADWNSSPLVVEGYDYLFNFSINDKDQNDFNFQGKIFSLRINSEKNGLVLFLDQKSIDIPLTKRFEEWMSEYTIEKSNLIPIDGMTIDVEGENRNIQLIIQHINLHKKTDVDPVLQSVSGFLLLKDS